MDSNHHGEGSPPSPTRLHVLFIVLLVTVLYAWRLGSAPLWDRDEPRNAGCAMEMQARGDWVVPFFNDELRTHKPVLLYWLMMSAYSVFGANEFSARIWSAILSAGTVCLSYCIGCRLASPKSAIWSAAVLATSLLFTMSARAATPDATLIFFSTLAIWSFVRFCDPGESDPTQRFTGRAALAIYGAMGMAVLAKGPVGVALPTTLIVTFRFWRLCSSADIQITKVRQGLGLFWATLVRTLASMRLGLGFLIVIAVAGPWYVWVGLRSDGIWLREFLGVHNFGRALHAMEGHSGPAAVYYPASLLVGFFPWSIVVIPVVVDLVARRRRRGRFDAWEQLSLAWIAVYLIVFSIARTKLPSYLLPAYPAVALLAGAFVDRHLQRRAQFAHWWLYISFTCQFLTGVAIAGLVWWAAQEHLPGSNWLASIASIPILLAAIGIWATARGMVRLQIGLLTATAVLLNMGIFGVATGEVGRYQRQAQMLQAFARQKSPDEPLVAFGRLEPSWVYYAGRPIKFFGLEETDALTRFLADHKSAALIAAASDRPRLPPGLDTTTLAESPYFFQHDRLLVLGAEPVIPEVAFRP